MWLQPCLQPVGITAVFHDQDDTHDNKTTATFTSVPVTGEFAPSSEVWAPATCWTDCLPKQAPLLRQGTAELRIVRYQQPAPARKGAAAAKQVWPSPLVPAAE